MDRAFLIAAACAGSFRRGRVRARSPSMSEPYVGPPQDGACEMATDDELPSSLRRDGAAGGRESQPFPRELPEQFARRRRCPDEIVCHGRGLSETAPFDSKIDDLHASPRGAGINATTILRATPSISPRSCPKACHSLAISTYSVDSWRGRRSPPQLLQEAPGLPGCVVCARRSLAGSPRKRRERSGAGTTA